MIIPEHKFLAWRGFSQDGAWKLKSPAGPKDEVPRFEIASHHWRYVSRAIEGNYPNWRAVLPDNGGFKTIVDIKPDQVTAVIQTVQRMPSHDSLYHTADWKSPGEN